MWRKEQLNRIASVLAKPQPAPHPYGKSSTPESNFTNVKSYSSNNNVQ
jgi:hypothetical protein